MGNVIPWSQIHPSIKSEEPFVAVVVLDPQRQLCVSEMIDLDVEALADATTSAGTLLGAAQAAAARVAAGYRQRRKALPERSQVGAASSSGGLPAPSRLRLIQGGLTKQR